MIPLLGGYEQQISSNPSRFDEVDISFIRRRKGDQMLIEWRDDQFIRQRKKQSLAKLVQGARPTHLALVWGGNQMNVRAHISDSRPFDVLLPTDTETAIDPAVELIPCSAVESYVRSSLVNHETLQELQDAATTMGLPVCMMETPPPLPAAAIRERLLNEPYWVGIMRELGISASDARIVPDSVRAKLWQLLISTYKTFAAERDYEFLELPDTMVDSHGMLESKYWGTDSTHANTEYGSTSLEIIVHWAIGSLN
jgi:hypothetical protein